MSPSSPGMAHGPEAWGFGRLEALGTRWTHGAQGWARADQGDPSVSQKRVEDRLELRGPIEHSRDQERGPGWARGERWEATPPGPPKQSLPARPEDSKASGRGTQAKGRAGSIALRWAPR